MMSRMTPKEMALTIGNGLLSFPVTPFDASNKFDAARYRSNLDWLCSHVPGAVQIGIDDRVPALYRKIDRRLRKLSAGAVDETVEAAMRGPDRVEQGVDRIGLPDVGHMR